MNASNALFVSAAIPYVNAEPHLGHALGFLLADAIARFERLRGRDVRFVTGTDENSLKSVRAAEARGSDVATLVAECSECFRQLCRLLEAAPDEFVRTSVDARHAATVERLWHACAARGDLYRRTYRGLYCVGCEDFYRERELVDGLCPEHATAPEPVEEENWFFRLSRYEGRLRELIRSGELAILPAERRNEALAFIDGGLEDFSVSRSRARARGWGLAVPGDPDQIVFVWFDALANYISALVPGSEAFDRFWTEAPDRIHVIGKGILRFHAVYWPAILLSAGVRPPSAVHVHGYLTASGKKIGKSLGNAVDPFALVGELGAPALRHHLLRHVPTTKDADFARERLAQTRKTDLADQLGNLVQRALKLVGEIVPEPGALSDAEHELARAAADARRGVEQGFSRFDVRHAAESAWSFVASANRYVDRSAPWRLEPGSERRRTALYHLAEALRFTSVVLTPFLPATAAEIARRVGVSPTPSSWDEHARFGKLVPGTRVHAGPPLFPHAAKH